jgi:hypothetical protein
MAAATIGSSSTGMGGQVEIAKDQKPIYWLRDPLVGIEELGGASGREFVAPRDVSPSRTVRSSSRMWGEVTPTKTF